MGVSVSVDLEMEPRAAFDAFVEELAVALKAREIRFETGPNGGITDAGREIARVVSWQPGKKILLEWLEPDWKKVRQKSNVEMRFESDGEGTRVTLDHAGWGHLFDDRGGEIAGWFAGEVAAPLLHALTPSRLGDWVTDRTARRPSGAKARATYKDPVYHKPNFLAILSMLRLGSSDYLLEVGCGGGAFLSEALRSNCKAAAVDHSHEMVKLASEVNRDAIMRGRLIIHEAEADRLPYSDAIFSCAVMTGVFGFLPDPVAALSEIRRVLAKGGRLVVYTIPKELRGTPAAPEPIASRVRFYEDRELEQLAQKAGFSSVRVEHPDLRDFARQSGVPSEAVPLFSGRGGQFLIGVKG